MKKRTKIFIIIAIALVVLAVAGFFIGKYYAVNYAFDRFFEKGIASIADSAETSATPEEPFGEATPPPEENPDEPKPPEQMTEKEVIKEVMKDSALISKMSGMVSYSDRERIIAIVLSNFSSQEISHYSAMVAKGIDSKTKSELMSIARSRLTSAQLSECMQIAYKYADEIRPYLKKN
ncbi:MAG: hypothetical protein IKB89_00640 [Clostridia bacterium]|nr:hypothetical protein [Clostridia bacterium]